MPVALNCSASANAAFESGGLAEPARLWRCRWGPDLVCLLHCRPLVRPAGSAFLRWPGSAWAPVALQMGARKWLPDVNCSATTLLKLPHIASAAVHIGTPGCRGTPQLTVLPRRVRSAPPCLLQALFAAAASVHWPHQMTGCSRACSPAGHSLGGALAMLAAFDLAPLFPWGSVEVHTIGAPRPGNAAFAKVCCRLWPRQLHAMLLHMYALESQHALVSCCGKGAP